jgi:hypothetical protein
MTESRAAKALQLARKQASMMAASSVSLRLIGFGLIAVAGIDASC